MLGWFIPQSLWSKDADKSDLWYFCFLFIWSSLETPPKNPKKSTMVLFKEGLLSVQNESDFCQDLLYFCTKRTPSLSADTKATGPLEMLMPVIIQEFHAKSTFNKPFLRPQENLLQSALTIFSERQALFPQWSLGNVCVQTSWPCKGSFRGPVKT